MVFIVHCWKPNLQSLLGTSRPFSSAAQSPKRLDPVDKLLHQINGKAFALPIKGKDVLNHHHQWQFEILLGTAHSSWSNDSLLALHRF